MEPVKSSFRDPAGFLYWDNKQLFRQINTCYQNDYQMLMASGLYHQLVSQECLIAHKEYDTEQSTKPSEAGGNCYKVIQPDLIPFISYPYEWCFEQLKEAALLTLNIQTQALKHDMSLKDASAYNVQFINGKAIFIDTLSFEAFQNKPWVAYKQFCQHFLAPLLLMAKIDFRLNELLMTNIDGIPLDLASKLLPKRSYFNPAVLMHIHLHARQQQSSANASNPPAAKSTLSKNSLLAIIDNLTNCIQKIQLKTLNTEWHNYYSSNNNYEEQSLLDKERLVLEFSAEAKPKLTWDLGANDGRFSRVVSSVSDYVVSWDIDMACVQRNYTNLRSNSILNVLPLQIDLANPSASIGWANSERSGLMNRGGCDLMLALGLIHHLAISNNLPLNLIAQTFSGLSRFVIIEWIPKEDSQVVKLLTTRKDIFPNFTQTDFEAEFNQYFSIIKKSTLTKSLRTLYFLKKKDS